MDVDAVEQWTRNLRDVALNLGGRAVALVCGIAEKSAGLRVISSRHLVSYTCLSSFPTSTLEPHALLKDARRGQFDAVLVWKLDRLGRSLVHLVRLLQDLRTWGVELISFSEGLDFTTTTGKLLY